MIYIPFLWKKRKGTKLNRYRKENETATHVELVSDPVEITEEGTAFSEVRANALENAVGSISVDVDDLNSKAFKAGTEKVITSGDGLVAKNTGSGAVARLSGRTELRNASGSMMLETTADEIVASAGFRPWPNVVVENSGNNKRNWYAKFATITLPSLYNQGQVRFRAIDSNIGGQNTGACDVFCRVKRQSLSDNDPVISGTQTLVSGEIQRFKLYYVLERNTPSTIVHFYVQSILTNQTVRMTILDVVDPQRVQIFATPDLVETIPNLIPFDEIILPTTATLAGYAKTDDIFNRNDNISLSIGKNATGKENNVAYGPRALRNLTTGSGNTAFGYEALASLITGSYNTAFGYQALASLTAGSYNTAFGLLALCDATTQENVTGVGCNAQVTGDNQVQLGGEGTTVYAYGSVQDRSDIRDKTDVQDTELGLDFIERLRAVDFRWNLRESYFLSHEEFDAEIKKAEEKKKGEKLTGEERSAIIKKHRDFTKAQKSTEKKRTRFHHGFIAQEVKQVLDDLDTDFGGYQDHKINGGEDVLSLGYAEFIAPMVKAIQELSAQNKELVARIEALERGRA